MAEGSIQHNVKTRKETNALCPYCRKYFTISGGQNENKDLKMDCPHCGRPLRLKGQITFKRELIMKPLAASGILAILSVAYIMFWAVGLDRPSDPLALIGIAVSIFFVAFFLFVIVRTVRYRNLYRFLQENRDESGPIRKLSGPNTENSMKEFEIRYSRLMKQIEELPETGRDADQNFKVKLKEVAVNIGSVKEQLKQMSVVPLQHENLIELEKKVNENMVSLANIGVSVLTLKVWLKTRRSEHYKNFRNIDAEASWLLIILRESLKDLRKEENEQNEKRE